MGAHLVPPCGLSCKPLSLPPAENWHSPHVSVPPRVAKQTADEPDLDPFPRSSSSKFSFYLALIPPFPSFGCLAPLGLPSWPPPRPCVIVLLLYVVRAVRVVRGAFVVQTAPVDQQQRSRVPQAQPVPRLQDDVFGIPALADGEHREMSRTARRLPVVGPLGRMSPLDRVTRMPLTYDYSCQTCKWSHKAFFLS